MSCAYPSCMMGGGCKFEPKCFPDKPTPAPSEASDADAAFMALHKYTAGSSICEEEHFAQGFRSGLAHRDAEIAELKALVADAREVISSAHDEFVERYNRGLKDTHIKHEIDELSGWLTRADSLKGSKG